MPIHTPWGVVRKGIIVPLLCLAASSECFSPQRHVPNGAVMMSNSTDSGANSLLLVASSERGMSFAPSRFKMKVNGSNADNEMPTMLTRLASFIVFPLRRFGRIFRPRTPPPDADSPAAESHSESTTSESSKATLVPEETAKDSNSSSKNHLASSKHESSTLVPGRSATASVDLSGTWDLVVTDEFKEQYDKYLTLLGQPFLVRSVAVNIIALTSEETQQSEKGRKLLIRGKNVKGIWERTLIASAPQRSIPDFEPILTPIMTADDEEVLAEAWWEEKGTVHHSWLRGVEKYGGGSFESKRYLRDNGKTLICESTFHPNDPKRKKAMVTWRFQRQGS